MSICVVKYSFYYALIRLLEGNCLRKTIVVRRNEVKSYTSYIHQSPFMPIKLLLHNNNVTIQI